MTASMTLDRVGNIEIGLKLDFEFFDPLLLYIGMIWAIFQISGKWPISNKLLNNFESEPEICVEISCRNFPEIPQ